MSLTAARFAARLALDHQSVLHPDVDTPFIDEQDVVNRLLPYHVVQHPQHDLMELHFAKAKGKEKASALKWENEDTAFAIQCFKRREALRERFRKVKIRSGKHNAPSDQAYVLAQAVLEADRSENAWLTSELRSARSELERIEREKRAAAAQATRMMQFSSVAATATQTVQPQYYHRYPYAYTQAYGAHIPSSSTSTFAVSPAQPSAVTPSTPNTGQVHPSSNAIPVQLPVSSLPALHALGIVPVPATSLPPEGQPQPPAVLRGSTANGVMLSLEINVSLLHPPQMSGLAMILNSLMSRSTTNTAGSGVGPTTSIPSSSSMSTTGTPAPPGTNAGT